MKKELDYCVYIYKKLCNINIGSYRLRLEKKILYDTKNKIWRSA